MSPKDELLRWHGLRLDLPDKRDAARAAGDVARAKIYEGALTEVDAELAKRRRSSLPRMATGFASQRSRAAGCPW